MIKEEDAKEYFIKLCIDGNSVHDLAEELWKRMNKKERKQYFEELEEQGGENGK